jgi:hypothetical protein
MAKPTHFTLIADGKTTWIYKKPQILLQVITEFDHDSFTITTDDWTNVVLHKGNKYQTIKFLKTLL